jgi:hypothetical protein
MKALVAVPLVLLAGCAAVEQYATMLSGPWAGPGVNLMLEGGLGSVEFDCASGTIDQAIPSAPLPFTVKGTYRTGQSGPVRVGQIFKSQPATYSGLAVKTDMTLQVKLDDGTELGPFKLQAGGVGQLNPCR